MTIVMKKPRIGVIGGGVFGTQILTAFHYAHLKGDIELVALADLSEGVLEAQKEQFGVTGYTDYLQMFAKENLDAVAVVTPDYLHRQVVVDAANHGLHVLCQKPLDTSADGCLDMINAAKENNVLLCVDYHKRFDPGHILLRQQIADGHLGKIMYGYACMEDKIMVPAEWFKAWAHNSSPVWFLGVHFYDLIYWLINSKPVSCHAVGSKHKLKSIGIDTYDAVQAQFRFENGAVFTVDSSWILPNSFTANVNQNIKVVGSEGIYEVDSESRGILSALSSMPGTATNDTYAFLNEESKFYGSKPSGYAYNSMLYFTELAVMLRNGKTLKELKGYYCDGEEALISVKMAQAVHRSVESGCIETI